MAYDTTEVSVSKSQEQIRKVIYSHGGSALSLISHPPLEGFEAIVTLEKTPYHIRIMATCKDVTLDKWGVKKSGAALENARRREEMRVWRVLYWYLKAMFEAADSGVIDIRSVILPYIVTSDSRTIAEHLIPRMASLMNSDPKLLLSAPKESKS
jgi:hypothetical protein